jgi:hypothetical protein
MLILLFCVVTAGASTITTTINEFGFNVTIVSGSLFEYPRDVFMVLSVNSTYNAFVNSVTCPIIYAYPPEVVSKTPTATTATTPATSTETTKPTLDEFTEKLQWKLFCSDT